LHESCLDSMRKFKALVMHSKHDNIVGQGSNNKDIIDGLMNRTMFQNPKIVCEGMDDCTMLYCRMLVEVVVIICGILRCTQRFSLFGL
jgi:hypothetical protein